MHDEEVDDPCCIDPCCMDGCWEGWLLDGADILSARRFASSAETSLFDTARAAVPVLPPPALSFVPALALFAPPAAAACVFEFGRALIE